MRILIILVIIFVIIYLINKSKNKKSVSNNKSQDIYTDAKIVDDKETIDIQDDDCNNYSRKNLLTKNEWYFYKSLKPIADKYNLTILSKIRVADLLEPKSNLTKGDWQTAFNKISRKHIDFVLCNPDNLYPLLLIELDDKTHDNSNVIKRDRFIEKIYKQTGYTLLRVRNSKDLEEKIVSTLNLSLESN